MAPKSKIAAARLAAMRVENRRDEALTAARATRDALTTGSAILKEANVAMREEADVARALLLRVDRVLAEEVTQAQIDVAEGARALAAEADSLQTSAVLLGPALRKRVAASMPREAEPAIVAAPRRAGAPEWPLSAVLTLVSVVVLLASLASHPWRS